MKAPGPFCFECHQELSALQRMRFKYFCSEKHKTDWEQEFNVLGVVRLQEARVRMGMEDPKPRFAPASPAANAPNGSTAERRSAARADLDAPVRVTILDGDDYAHSGRFVNASAKGMKITMGIQLFSSTRVRVECGDHSIVGEVRRCHAGGAGYVIGLETIEWTDKREPAHSLTILGDRYGTPNGPSVATA
jgi:hypothetical protein